MKRHKSSFFGFIKVSGAHVLLKALAICVVMIILPCSVKCMEFSTSQVPTKLINGNLVSIKGIPKDFVSGNITLVVKNKQGWFEDLKELSRSFGLFFISEVRIGKQSGQKDAKDNIKNIVHGPTFWFFEGLFVSALMYWFLFFRET